jgi:hypothetical protein
MFSRGQFIGNQTASKKKEENQKEEGQMPCLAQNKRCNMTLFIRLFTVGCLALVLVAYSPAQTPSAAKLSSPDLATHQLPSHKTIESWLHSDDPRLVAWGAHDALLARDKSLLPDLLNLASQWNTASEPTADARRKPLSQAQVDTRDAMAAVVDTLIQMGATVPAETLRNLSPDFGNATAIFLTRISADDAQPLAYDFYHAPSEKGYGLQSVSAALLTQQPPSGFAADLLESITVQAEVVVMHSGAPAFGSGSAGDCFRELPVVRKDWPVTGQYRLSKAKSDGAVVVVRGVDPIYATRELSTTYSDDWCPGPYLGPSERQRLIAQMLGIPPESMPWRTNVQTNSEFISQEQFDLEFHRFIEDEEKKYRDTAAALASRGLLNDEEAQQSAPKLKLIINEMRRTEDDPLAQITNLPPNVEYSNSPWK